MRSDSLLPQAMLFSQPFFASVDRRKAVQRAISVSLIYVLTERLFTLVIRGGFIVFG